MEEQPLPFCDRLGVGAALFGLVLGLFLQATPHIDVHLDTTIGWVLLCGLPVWIPARIIDFVSGGPFSRRAQRKRVIEGRFHRL